MCSSDLANSADIKLDGQQQALANALASLPIDVRKAAKRRTNVIVQAVEASLGGQAKVYLAGSQAKHTDIWSSDHDYWVETGGLGVSRTERTDLRDNLASLLTERGWRPRLVVLLETSVRLSTIGRHRLTSSSTERASVTRLTRSLRLASRTTLRHELQFG